ncbi:MAG: PKD domain-containing protein, partial [Planctomycetota bacterium]
RRAGSQAIRIGDGERPLLLLDKAGRAPVLYAADGGILLRFEASSARPGVFGEPRAVARPVEGGIRFSAAFSADQSIHVAYSDGEAVFTTDNALGPFSTPIEIARGGAREPCVSVSEGSAKAVAFERGGDVHVCLGTTFFLLDPIPVAATEEMEASPAPIFDPLGTLAIVFRRGGELYATTDAGIPQAKFSAEPTSGPAPLRVSFRDESVGPVAGWRWEFGDGAVSTERHPYHVFELAGEYTVSLSVSGPGGESPVSYRQAIRVLDPRNEMYVGRLRVFPGQKGVHVPVVASHDAPAQGFTIVATYDPRVLAVTRAAFEKTNIESLHPELFALTVSDDPADPYIVLGVLFDVEPPFDGRQLPPGRDRRIADIVVDVRPDAPAGSKTRVELKNQLGRPPLNNIITVSGRSVLPVLRSGGEIELARLRFPPPRFFLRGDTNGDRAVNLTDAVTTLDYLFYGKKEPDCFDAADTTDDGQLDITDSIFTLNFLFLSGSCPPAPYPDPGLDPTDDGLPPCLLR